MKKSFSSGKRDDEKCVLVLQGGGALGSYQAGVYEELQFNGMAPQWVAGTSIGAINAALIAGNPPERRVSRLKEFWEGVSSQFLAPVIPGFFGPQIHEWHNETSFLRSAVLGVPGFFAPRFPPPAFFPSGSLGALSYYDTTPLRGTLERLIDFDLLNTKDVRHKVRLSVSAVNIETGNLTYFDTANMPKGKLFTPEHIMASGALPPAFAPVKIEDAYYWDGGIVSNNPLQYVVDQPTDQDMLIFEIDLFSARGDIPQNIGEVNERMKDIQFSSRTRLNTNVMAAQQKLSQAAKNLVTKLPAKFADDPDLQALLASGTQAAVTVLLLIYRSKHFETQSKDAEFSRPTMLDHWAAGVEDVQRSLASKTWCDRSKPQNGVAVLDLSRHD